MQSDPAHIASTIVAVVLSVGAPAIVAVLWRVGTEVARVAVRLDALGERVSRLEAHLTPERKR
jgi:hypothetical protein